MDVNDEALSKSKNSMAGSSAFSISSIFQSVQHKLKSAIKDNADNRAAASDIPERSSNEMANGGDSIKPDSQLEVKSDGGSTYKSDGHNEEMETCHATDKLQNQSGESTEQASEPVELHQGQGGRGSVQHVVIKQERPDDGYDMHGIDTDAPEPCLAAVETGESTVSTEIRTANTKNGVTCPEPVTEHTGQTPQAMSSAVTEEEDTVQPVTVKCERLDDGYETQNGRGVAASSVVSDTSDGVCVKVEDSVGNDFTPSDDVCIVGCSYRVPYSDSESDSDASSLSGIDLLSEIGPEPEVEPIVVRTKGEIFPEELPPLEDLHISISENTKLEKLGVVTSIVGVLVVIESTADLTMYSPVNEDTVLFYEDRKPFGKVFEVFGPCKAPAYSIRFNTVEEIATKGIIPGLVVFFVPLPDPELADITHYVFVDRLKKLKGSDASWENNNEPPDDVIEYSDDEAERRAKAKRKAERKQRRKETDKQGDEDEEQDTDEEQTEKKRNGWKDRKRERGNQHQQHNYRRPGKGEGSQQQNGFHGPGNGRAPQHQSHTQHSGFSGQARGQPSPWRPTRARPGFQAPFSHSGGFRVSDSRFSNPPETGAGGPGFNPWGPPPQPGRFSASSAGPRPGPACPPPLAPPPLFGGGPPPSATPPPPPFASGPTATPPPFPGGPIPSGFPGGPPPLPSHGGMRAPPAPPFGGSQPPPCTAAPPPPFPSGPPAVPPSAGGPPPHPTSASPVPGCPPASHSSASPFNGAPSVPPPPLPSFPGCPAGPPPPLSFAGAPPPPHAPPSFAGGPAAPSFADLANPQSGPPVSSGYSVRQAGPQGTQFSQGGAPRNWSHPGAGPFGSDPRFSHTGGNQAPRFQGQAVFQNNQSQSWS